MLHNKTTLYLNYLNFFDFRELPEDECSTDIDLHIDELTGREQMDGTSKFWQITGTVL